MKTQDTVFRKNSAPIVMGILNVTPDSFFDGGKYNSEKVIVNQAKQMLEEGAAIIDIGAYSTRPGATDISEAEELKRLIPAIRTIRKEFQEAIISADTFRANIAKQAVEAGADIINDISGGTLDSKMFETVAKLKVPYILTHIKGAPQTMQENPEYANVTAEVKDYFKTKISELKKLGTEQIILDPGFGFGKTTEHNYQLLKHLDEFKCFGLPLLIGASRKGMIHKVLGIKAAEALNGTTVINTLALLNGANILRVHDVKEAGEAIKLLGYYNKDLIS